MVQESFGTKWSTFWVEEPLKSRSDESLPEPTFSENINLKVFEVKFWHQE